MSVRTRRRTNWTCRECGHVNEPRARSRKCQNPECGAMSRPLKRRPAHSATLRTDSYETYAALSFTIHGGEYEACGVCRKPKPDGGKHHRDHDHQTGNPRGLACGGNRGCNLMMLPWIDAPTAFAIAKAKYPSDEATRWKMIGDYLSRVDAHYAVVT